tara:strand:- start:1350 stop:1568 length:219 start_codon:yes stop_codon:yes gene_type:complete
MTAKIIKFPEARKFTLYFNLPTYCQMSSSTHQIAWKIHGTQGEATLMAHNLEQAKELIEECVCVLSWVQDKW